MESLLDIGSDPEFIICRQKCEFMSNLLVEFFSKVKIIQKLFKTANFQLWSGEHRRTGKLTAELNPLSGQNLNMSQLLPPHPLCHL